MDGRRYYYFIRLMGRGASHIALECALQTHPDVVRPAPASAPLLLGVAGSTPARYYCYYYYYYYCCCCCCYYYYYYFFY